MADLRTRFLEDYAGGLLNIARQEVSSTGEVLAQDGFVDGLSLFVEDGRGVKSGLRLGSSLVECVDPTTDTGVVNVRTADRTYAKIRDLKIFSTAVASAQAALSESVADSLTNLEGAFDSLENDLEVYRARTNDLIDGVNQTVSGVSTRLTVSQGQISTLTDSVNSLSTRLSSVESTIQYSGISKQELTATITSPIIDDGSSSDVQAELWNYYALLYVSTDVPAWVSFYVSNEARENDERVSAETPGEGVIADIVTDFGSLTKVFAPAVIGYGGTTTAIIRIRNESGLSSRVTVNARYVKL